MESAPTGCGMPLCIPWAPLAATETATGRRGRRPLRSCCLPIHWFVGAAHVRPAAVRRRSFAGSRRARHARPLPHDDIKKHKKPQLCVFCTAAALFTLFYALTYPASRARHRSCGCSGRGSCLRRSSRRWRPCRRPAGQRAQTPEWVPAKPPPCRRHAPRPFSTRWLRARATGTPCSFGFLML